MNKLERLNNQLVKVADELRILRDAVDAIEFDEPERGKMVCPFCYGDIDVNDNGQAFYNASDHRHNCPYRNAKEELKQTRLLIRYSSTGTEGGAE